MVACQRNLVIADESLQLFQEGTVEGIEASDGNRDAMSDDRKLFGEPLEVPINPSSDFHVVFRGDLEPV